MRSILFPFVAALAFLPSAPAASPLLISEFMAINNTGLADEDGAFSDWVEIHNTASTNVDVGGWYLTDNAASLTKWMFPSTNIPPGGFLVVFCSGKDRRVPGAPLHTSFNLNGNGEYLALVMPDGVTKATEFAPAFPSQYADVPYGFPMSGTSTLLVASGANARALVPTADIGATWRGTFFNDTAWLAGTTGVGYDGGTNYQPAIGLDVKAAMSNLNATAYLRVPFTVTNPAAFKALTLRMSYDDGFVAYLNGTELARRNAPASPAWNSAATAAHGTPAPASLVEDFEGPGTNYTLTTFGGGFVPSVQPAGSGSTGKFLRLLNDGVNGAANIITFRQTGPGLFEQIIADFDFRINEGQNAPADGFAFMLIPTSTYGTSGAGVNITSQAVEEPNYAGVFAVGFDVYPHDEPRNDVSVHWNGGEKVNVTVPRSTLEFVANVFHRVHVTLQHVTGGARVSVTITPNINGTPGAPYTPITNFFVAGLNPFDCRVQFGGRTGGLNLGLDLDNINVQFIPAGGVVPFEEFDATAARNWLLSGTNVLAVHGLNVAANDRDFLIVPELLGHDFQVATQANYIYPPTPGFWNNVTGAGTLAAVTFFPAAGVYTNGAVDVTLASSSSSATIRYTLDGSVPDATSLLYTGPVHITANTVIRARAFETGKIESPITAANYVILDSTLTNWTSNLPLVLIDTMGGTVVADSKIPAYAVFIDTNLPNGRVAIYGAKNYSGRVGIEYHGQSSLGFPKRSYNLEVDDERDRDLDVPLLGLPKGADWVLYAPYTDKTFMNDYLAFELHEAMGHYAVRRRFVEVFVRETPGQLTYNDYRGIYVLLEKIRISEDRLNLATLDANDNTEPNVTGGYVWKKDKDSPGDVNFSTSSGQVLKYHDPRGDELTPDQRNWLVNHLNQFEAALYGANWRDPVAGYAKYIDLDSFVDQHWIVEFPKNIDGYRLSNFMHKDRNGKIFMDPIWDWNLSFGNANYLEGGLTNGWYFTLTSEYDDIWLKRLRSDPDFYQRIVDRWGELRTNLFALSNVLARVDRITNQLHEAQARDFAKWPRLGSYVWPNPNGAAGGWHVDFVTPTSFAGIIQQMKNWITGRYYWLNSQFLIAPTLSRPGGAITNGTVVTLSAPLGSVYYTLDGTDPRASGGGVSTAARLYSGPITLTNNAGLFARAFHTNSWSPPARAVYVITTPSLRITELMYHPENPPTNSLYLDEDFEFVEIQNTGSEAVNLSGTRLAGGIDYTFSPNVLVPTGTATSNRFDGGGTTYTATTLNAGPSPTITAGGPNGSFMRLLGGGSTTLMRNRLAFAQTASGPYGRLVADFDVRATTVGSAPVTGTPTIQDFTSGGTAYAVANSGATPVTVQPGDTGSTGHFLRLVPASGNELGTVAFARTAAGTWTTIIATFDFRITPPSEANQADGMSFALLNTANFGTSGTAPAISEEPNLVNSLGVGFDVYNNAEVNNNHVSLHWNGAMVGSPATPSFDMSNGRFHRAQIIVRFSGGSAYVTVRLTPDINGTPGAPVTLFQEQQISGVPPYESRVAFGARTGGAWASHDLDNVNVQYTQDPGTSAGLSLLLLPAATFGAGGAGTTLSHFTDLPRVANVLALDLAFHPSNLVNDAMIYWNAAPTFGASLSPATLDLDNGLFHHVRLELEAASGGTYATLIVTPDSLGSPGTPITLLSDVYIAGASLPSGRIELAGRNGSINTTLDVENLLVTYEGFAPNTLAPGETVLVVKNRAAFESRYGPGYRIAGEFAGRLNNAGDHLMLLGPVGEPILDFTFSDNWYPITDGLGFSLVIQDAYGPTNLWDLKSAWRASSYRGGSPNAPDPALPAIPPIKVNEALANSVPPDVDRIELFNPTANDVDIGGWFLTDAFFSPKKFRIPDGTIIPAGGFRVFTEADFNPTPGLGTSFALDAEGDDAWLFSADAEGNLTGYVHGFDYGASDEGVSFGRYVNSVGSEHFVAQIAQTFGGLNAGPRIGPVVISEIMYHPPDIGTNDNQLEEFVELENISPAPVELFDPVFGTNTWRLRNAVDYDFPTNVVLQPGQRVLVVSFDPVLDPVSRDAFTNKYGLGPEVALFGPYSGKLDNSDERIELRRPGQLTPAGTIPSVLVEAVHYRDSLPWATNADGTGASLQRFVLNAYGNDPSNWFAAGSSPGAATVLNQWPVASLDNPAPASIFTRPVTISLSAQATDADGSVATVLFLANGVTIGEDSTPPYAFDWTDPTPGSIMLLALARDNLGSYGTSAPVTITVISPAPTVAITTPTDGATLSGGAPIALGADAGDVDGTVTNVAFLVDGVKIGDDTTAPYTVSWLNAPGGPHVLTAIAADNFGITATSAPVNVTIQVQPPVVSLTAPTNDAILTAGATVTVTADATDPDGSITNVAFYADGAKIGDVPSAPFSMAWVPALGPHVLSAVATDNNGLNATSAPVNVFAQLVINSNLLVIASNAVWKYLDDGSTAATNWKTLDYDDSGWSNGIAQLGWGDGDEGTVIRRTNIFGGIITHYFRKTFILPTARGITNAELKVMLDDGAVAYLNGTEVFRRNMPAGAPTNRTLATVNVSGAAEYTLWPTNFNPGLLLKGTNLLAVELHQFSSNNIDASFAAELRLAQYYVGPAITGQPQDQALAPGDDVTFTVTASGSEPLTYQWYHETTPLPDATNATLTLSNVGSADAGGYSVVVANDAGAVTSRVATLTLSNPDTDGDGIPDAWELAHGLDPGVATDASQDRDGDGLTNLQEFLAGTDPGNPASTLKVETLTPPGSPGGVVTISFPGVSGHSYRVLYRNRWDTNPWQVLTNVPVLGTDQTVTVVDPDAGTETERYYRLVTPGQ